MIAFRTGLRWLLGLFFIAAGGNHFANPGFYVRIMPPYLPGPLVLVYLSGVFEMLLGVFVFIPRFYSRAGWGIIALLIAVFPANLQMALNPQLFPEYDAAMLWGRIPLQGLIIYWAWWCTRKTS